MRAILSILLISSQAIASHATAAEVDGVKLAERLRIGATELVLNGAGLRKRSVFKVYVAGLYLTERRSNADAVLSLAGAKRFSMTLLRDITSQQLIEALEEGLQDNHPPAEVERMRPRTARLAGIMSSIGVAHTGAVVAIDYVPGSGTRVALNDKWHGDPIEGEDFYRAILRIWIGDAPPDRTLKSKLLGE